MSRLQDLGRQVAALQDADLETLHAAERAGAGFIRAIRQQSQRASAKQRPVVYLLVAVLVGVLAVVIGRATLTSWTAARPLAVTPAIAVGDPIAAPLDRSIPLRFSDGSEVELAPGAEAVIRRLTTAGAHVDLTRGSAEFSVQHRPETNWSLRAGPYAVEVTGTHFDLAWSPKDRRFTLELWEGSVRVRSEQSEHSAVEMVAPERLVIDAKGWHLSRAENAAEETPEPSAAPAAVESAAPAPPPASTASAVPKAPPTPPSGSWEQAASRGDYRTAYEAARAQGLGTLAQSGSASQLIALAEACRLSGHGGEGVAVLSRLRARFPNTEEAALAAFQLGRLTGAARWFQTYLDERPNGKLAREALGRLMESLDRSGAHPQAQAAARRYLATYPAGPHAAIAARILDD